MALILAIEPDARQAAQLTGIVRHRLNAELLLADTTERALDAIGDRVPDLVLIPALLSPQDDAALAAALRVIAAAANVRTLTIPVFASAPPRAARGGVLGRWRKSRESQPDGCDPAVFAEQISTYLAEAIAERAAAQPEAALSHAADPAAFGDEVFFEPVPAYEPPAPSVIVAAVTQPIIEPDAPAIVSVPLSTIVIPSAAATLDSAPRAFDKPLTAAAFESAPLETAAAEMAPIADASIFVTPDVLLIEYPAADALVESIAPPVAREELREYAAVEEETAIEQEVAIEGQEVAIEEQEIAIAEEEIAIEEPLVELAAADVEAEAAPEATILAFHPASERMVEPIADTVAHVAMEDAPIEDATPLRAFDDTSFDVSEFTADIVEIDLSDETRGEAIDEESVFELNLDEGDEVFAIEALPRGDMSPRLDAELAEPIAAASTFLTGANVDEAATQVDLDDADLHTEFSDPAAGSDLELWMPLSVSAAHLWPVIEGVASEFVDPFAAVAAPPPAPKSEHPEWTELIASLRQDMERRRENVEPTPITRVVPRRKAAKPVQDEWGFFDPQQCGFAALLAKLDEITDANEEPASRLA